MALYIWYAHSSYRNDTVVITKNTEHWSALLLLTTETGLVVKHAHPFIGFSIPFTVLFCCLLAYSANAVLGFVTLKIKKIVSVNC